MLVVLAVVPELLAAELFVEVLVFVPVLVELDWVAVVLVELFEPVEVVASLVLEAALEVLVIAPGCSSFHFAR